MNSKEWGRKWLWPNLRHYPGICLKGMQKTIKHISQDSRCPSQDSNWVPPKYDSGALPLEPAYLVVFML
jgi:hypothetical protein